MEKKSRKLLRCLLYIIHYAFIKYMQKGYFKFDTVFGKYKSKKHFMLVVLTCKVQKRKMKSSVNIITQYSQNDKSEVDKMLVYMRVAFQR